MRRLLPILVTLVIVAPNAGATGQIKVEADDAAERLEETARQLDGAEVELAVVLDDLVGAVAAWNAVVGEQTTLAFEVAGLQEQLTAAELRSGAIKESIRARVVDSYMAGGNTLLPVVLSADSLTDIATAQMVFEGINQQADAELAALAEERQGITALREELAAEEDRLDAATSEVATLIDELDILFADADVQVREAHDALVAADSEYRAAYALLQQMLALQRATGPGVERWRPVVEHYFAPDRVEQALEVMWCESRGNPKATHPLSGASGLFQFMEGTWAAVAPRAGFDGASRYDPEANIASAAWLLEFTIESGHPRGDWGRWTCQPTTLSVAP